jgi:hypothetical protein
VIYPNFAHIYRDCLPSLGLFSLLITTLFCPATVTSLFIMEAIKQTFAKCKAQKRAALVAYITAGYPTVEEAVDILLGLENGGAGNSTPK